MIKRFALLGQLMLAVAIGAMTLLIDPGNAEAAQITNAASGDWWTAATWNPAQVPNDGDDVVIKTGTVVLTNETKQLSSLIITNSTLSFSNWTTRLRGTNVTLLNAATITTGSAFTNNAMSNRVWIVCSNFSLASNATINVDGKGWSGGIGAVAETTGHGPGRGLGNKASAGYGGYGTMQELVGFGGGLPYGSVSAPVDPGSGGGTYTGSANQGGPGGGAVRIEADAGHVLINGTITANGLDKVLGSGNPGSGGAIYISSRTFAGTGGVIRANGIGGSFGGSGGGRIAITYNAAEQANLPIPSVVFSAARGALPATREGDIGTVYLTDIRFLKEVLTGFTGQLHCASSGTREFSALTVSNAWIRLAQDSARLTVTNDLKVVNGGILEIGANVLSTNSLWDRAESSGWNTRYRMLTEMTANPFVECFGNMVLTNGGIFRVYAGMTNATIQTGAQVRVTGTLNIASNSWFYPVSHGTNGGSVFLKVGGINVVAGGGINADGLGLAPPPFLPTSIEAGLGDGKGRTRRAGAGYGGTGGQGLVSLGGGYSYGDSNAPVHAGSSGGRYPGAGGTYWAGAGGGAILIDARGGTARIDGTLSAQGGRSSRDSGSGSGGSIFIQCKTLTGASGAAIRADGGSPWTSANESASGGGGRIAVVRVPALDTYAGTYSVTNGTNAAYYGTTGTVVFLADPNIPVVSNQAPAGFDASSAAMVGYLTSTGTTPTTLYCFWGTNDGGTVKANWMTNDSLGIRSAGYYTNSVSGLSPITDYYYRFYASNSWSDAWSPSSNKFTTTGGFVVNNNGGATDITTTSAKLRGEVVANATCDVYVCWGSSNPPENSTSVWEHADYAGSFISDSFFKDIAGLLANKTNYYRCYATNIVEGGSAWAPSSTNFPTASPNLLISDTSVTEGNAGDYPQLSFGVTLSATSASPVSVDFATSNGTATAGSDFTGTSGTLTIPAGIVSTSIAVTVTGDITDEFPYETLYVVLSNAVAVSIPDTIALGTINDDDDEAGTKVWNSTGDWTTHANWSPFGQPSPSDAVTIQSGNLILSSPQSVASVIVSNGATLTFTNWTTKLTLSGDMTIRSNGTVTIPAAFTNGMMSNRVWIACSTLSILQGGKIDVDGKGFAGGRAEYGVQSGFGPGAGIENKSAGAYGGSGGRQEPTVSGGSLPYGIVSEPEAPGSGGGSAIGAGSYGGAGGGAVRIEASSGVTVDGTITANGATPNAGAPGSGGGIYITCSTITGTGVVRADGVYASSGGIITRSGGGRIAVDYNSGAQALIAVPPLAFSAGTPPSDASGLSSPGDLGTLYFPDNRLLQRNPLTGLTGQWHSASAELGLSELTMSNSWLRLVTDGIRVTVTNDLLLGANGRLEIGGNVINSNVWWDRQTIYKDVLARPMTEMTANPALTCGSLSLANGSALWVYAGLAPAAGVTGATVNVSGMLTVASNAWIYPVSHATNGGSVLFTVSDMSIAAGGGINANGLGQACKANWSPAGGYGPGSGYQFISGQTAIGGGHGGTGGNAQPISGQPYGQIYGSSNQPPFYCGSGGGANGLANTYRGGSGGGLVWIHAIESVTLDGTLSANGGNCMASSGAGSGGGIYLTSFTLAGTGTMQANGGSAESVTGSGTGGGGRIAIFRMADFDTFTGVGVYSYAAGTNGATSGTVGTLSLYCIPRGTVFKFR